MSIQVNEALMPRIPLAQIVRIQIFHGRDGDGESRGRFSGLPGVARYEVYILT
jgi:hypothetical protein